MSGVSPFSGEIEEIRARMKGAFAPIHLTLLSIIQGTALAALSLKVDSLMERQSFHAPQLIITAGIFVTIVALWQQYQMGLMLYHWTAHLLDSFIPFVFGVFEFAMIIEMDHGASAVLIALGLFSVVAFIGFEYQYWQVRASTGAETFIRRLTKGFRWADLASSGVSAAILLATAVALGVRPPSLAGELTGAWILTAVGAAQVVRLALEWRIAQRRMSEMYNASP